MAVCEGVKLWHKTKEKKVEGGGDFPVGLVKTVFPEQGAWVQSLVWELRSCMPKRGKWEKKKKKEKWHFADSTLVSGRCRLGTQDSGCVLTPELGTITNQKEHKLCSSMLQLPITD